MNTVVFDLDGTIANIDHRLHLVKKDKPDWDLFYSLCKDDELNLWCSTLIRSLYNSGLKIVIVSGRRKAETERTITWLRNHNVVYYEIYLLRGDKDYTPDHVLKKKWLCEDPKRKEDILFVVDDRQRVVNMWREEGLTCLQCYAWEEFKRKKDVPTP